MLLAFTEQGSGPVVVLLHGFPLSRVMWAEQLKTLSESYRVIAPDLRGHGESPAPDAAYTMDLMADDVVELLDGLGVSEPVVVGGLSMGGYVALAMALKHPGRVRALMLIDTKAAADSPEAAQTREETAQAVLKAGNSGEVVAAMIPKLFGKSTLARHPDRVEPLKAEMEKTSASGVAGALRGMAIRPDRREQLAEIAVPTLVIVGEDDVIAPPAEARAMAEALPNGRLEVVSDAGHLAPYENPDAVDQAILGFLQGLN
ncbi:alpha/beta fold hydrolase [Paludisphaera borealis]|uniref:3-oxoadipate enol-lactonase 2 n=1 Tax=Paludisphaera borealis TaxID=1387353 RepID=A0A1U7CY22_9BACT|nr:alpha/beta fold hydrolase [Paludisphaera borealis]APW63844.1 3-oxoadipate enol-lactonase 2 [Paludisphaera borealis]